MAAQIGQDDDLANLERLRSRLDDSIAKLRTALDHWQRWDIEYEALKEEFQALKDPTQEQILNISDTFGGDLVDKAEIKDLSGISKGLQRTPDQIADMITRRQDYVRKNADTILNRLIASEEKFQSLMEVKEEFQDENGLPIMDIVEELDDDDNVISGTVAAPSQAAAKIVEALDKAGIDIETSGTQTDPAQTTKDASATTYLDLEPEEIDPTVSDKHTADVPPAATKKSVSFSEDTKTVATESANNAKSALSKRRLDPDIAKGVFMADPNGPSRIIELDDDDLPIGSMPIQLQPDTRDEADLRREMLHYVQEVGSVVAEMDLEEDEDDFDDEDYDYDDDDLEELDTEGEDEDEFGRTTRPVISDAYRERMLALEQKLNARMMQNVGPHPSDETKGMVVDEKLAKSAHRLVVRKEEEDEEIPAASSSTSKKGVRFAEDLDISPSPIAQSTTAPATRPTKKVIPPTFSEAVVERQAPQVQNPAEPPKPKKVSRFKSERGNTPASQPTATTPPPTSSLPFRTPDQPRPRPTPTGPEGQILANAIIERDSLAPSATNPDDLDPELMQREAEAEFHKMRNRMIQRQGGFLPADDEDDGLSTLVEEREDGSVRPVSRFKAARLKAAGM